jgi:hypothetical protein
MSTILTKEKRKYASQYYADKYYKEYNYKDYSKTANYKAISSVEVGTLKKFKWEWTASAINKLGVHPYSKRTIRKYKFHELTINNC